MSSSETTILRSTEDSTDNLQSVTVFRLSSANRLLQWMIEMKKIESEESKVKYVLRKKHGIVNGKITADKEVIVTTGKAGRSIKEQAQLQFNSLLKKKLDMGYTTTSDGINENHHISPMLAQNYEKHKSKIQFPALAQPKLDGVRCIVQYKNGVVTLISRKGKPFLNMEPITLAIKRVKLDENIVLDGELFSDVLDFQRLVGMVRKKTLREKDRVDLKHVKFNVFDCIHLADASMPFSSRWCSADEIVKRDVENVLKIVPIYPINDESEINTHLKTFLENGNEGIMIRNRDSPYEIDRRSYHLQKYKKFFDAEYKIVDAIEGTGNDKGTVVWVCEIDNMDSIKRFRVRPTGTRGERKKLWKDKEAYFGRYLTVKFQELTNDGIPRFPVGIALRDYE